MKAAVPEPVRRESFRRGRVTWAAERARRAKAHVVEQHDQNVGGTFGRPQRLDGRILRFRVFGIEGRQTHVLPVRNGKN